ncbi:MAG TPA: GAF domain-containing sensor histidine kinase [Candidatus Limnocylindrales bacterium]|nr:GAF domain-containing sensor histidine kinase [Candidatus Limnocylindrales bacterium]
MTATEFVSIANEIIFFVVFVVTVARAARLRTPPSIDIALLFGVIVAAQQLGNLYDLLDLQDTFAAAKTSIVVVAVLPYLLLRITDHFAPQRRWFMFGALAITLAVAAVGVTSPMELPNSVAALLVGWFAIGGGYASASFIRHARRAPGVTGRRLTAAAIGSGLLALALVLALIGLVLPPIREWGGIFSQLLVTAGGIAYYVGFATPTWLRRAWQEPSVRSFLAHSAELTREPDERAMVRRLEQLAAEAAGTATASIGIASDDGTTLRYLAPNDEVIEAPSDRWLAGRAYTSGEPVFSFDPAADDPDNAASYREAGTAAVMAAPIVAGDRRFGTLVIYASRTPVFAHSDIELTEVLARQTGGILEARTLLREAADVQARDAAARAKEDFLSAAAHDLRTPLSSMVLRVQLLKKRLEREGSPHVAAVDAVNLDAARVADFVDDLLDASRAEQGRLSTTSEPIDLAELAEDVAAGFPADSHQIVVEAEPAPVIGDRRRLQQVIENLLGNARKYSPDGGPIRLTVARAGDLVRTSVKDRGIGIPSEDLPKLFQRFSRGANVDDRRFSGLGLGLYICRRIVEEHGGRIWAESALGAGTTVSFELPSSGAQQEQGDE